MICVQRPGIGVLRGVTSLWGDGEPGFLTCGLEERSERARESRRNVGFTPFHAIQEVYHSLSEIPPRHGREGAAWNTWGDCRVMVALRGGRGEDGDSE